MKETILLVEDEAIIAMDQAARLEKQGFEVETASNGPAAVELINSSKKIDLILMDIDLGRGEMDGTEAAEIILKNKDLPILFLSSHTEQEIVEKTEKITSYGYVVKNSGDTVLHTSIKMAFRLFKANQEIERRREESEEAFHELEFREFRLQHINRILHSMRNINQIITKDPERNELLDKTCSFLVETNGYRDALIVLLENGNPVEPYFHAGFKKKKISPIIKMLQSGYIPPCVEKVLKNEELSVVENPEQECSDCQLGDNRDVVAEIGHENGNLTARIEHRNHVYGWLSVSVPRVYAHDPDEHRLLQEIVQDLGYALHKIEIDNARKQAFSDIRDREQFLHDVFSSIRDGISVLDPNLTIRKTNEVMKSWYANNLPLEGKKCFLCYQNREEPCNPCPSLKALESGQEEMEIVPGLPVSPVEWIELFSYPIKKAESGEIEGIVEFVRDITERKRAEETLRESKHERDTILDSLVEHVIYEDRDLRIKWPNRAACESAALDREELIGRHCYEIWPNQESPCPDCPVLKVLQTGEPTNIEKRTPDGKWWFIRGYPVRDMAGEIIGAVEVTLDITERKTAEEVLYRNEVYLRSTLHSIGDAVIATDVKGNVVKMNPIAAQLTGWDIDEAFGKPLSAVFSIINAKTREVVANPVDEVLEKGETIGLANHTVLISKDGKEFQIADSAAPIKDFNGNIFGVVLVFRDVTEEYRMREALKASEDRLAKTLFAANDGTWDWNLDTDEVYFDKRYYEMAGYECDEFPHRFEEFQKRVHPEDIDYVLKSAEKHLNGEIDQFYVEFRFARKDGDWIWILGRGKIVERRKDGSPKRFVGTHTDINKRKEIEGELRTERRRLADVLEGTNVGSWEWNVQTGETVFDERWAEIIGYTLDEISPTSLETWISFVHSKDLEKSNGLLEKHFTGELPYYECEARMKHKDGNWVWVLDRGKVSTWTEDGKPLLMSGTHQDITERKKSEGELIRAIEEKDHLFKELQHRVKNNLSMIISMINLKVHSVDSADSKRSLEAIASRVKALAELYSILHQSDSIDDVRLDIYCTGIMNSMQSLCESVRLSANFEKSIAPHKTAASLGLILTELVTNAIRHGFPENADGTIQVSLHDKGTQIILEVSNDGTPLPSGFDLSSAGGLGLRLVQALADQHQGSLRIIPGKETVFVAELYKHNHT